MNPYALVRGRQDADRAVRFRLYGISRQSRWWQIDAAVDAMLRWSVVLVLIAIAMELVVLVARVLS